MTAMKRLTSARPQRFRAPLLRGLTLALAALFAACSSTPSASPALAASTSSLEAARASGAAELAPSELNTATTKLERARMLAQRGDNVAAIRLAEQADVDAQAARAKASSERSRRAVAEVESSLKSLRDELNRTPASPPGLPPAQPPTSPR